MVSTTKWIQDFLNLYPRTTKTFADVLIHGDESLELTPIGIRNAKTYKNPTVKTRNDVRNFLILLYKFEQSALNDNPDDKEVKHLYDKLVQTIKDLNLIAARPRENVTRDMIIFAPKVFPNKPVEIGAVLIYRFGFIQYSSNDDSPKHSVSNLCLVSEHTIADGSERLNCDIFFGTNAKFLLSNIFKPHIVLNPATKGNAREYYFTDPAHSVESTIFMPMLTTLLQNLFPKTPVMIMHGMRERQTMGEFLLSNAYGAMRSDGFPSYARLLAVSFAIEFPRNYGSIGTGLPNTIRKNDKIIPISSDKFERNGALGRVGTINTNHTGHIAYFLKPTEARQRWTNPFKCSDRAIHVETTNTIRNNTIARHPNRDKFVKAVKIAVEMLRNYDPAIHHLEKLKFRFPEVARDMNGYIKLFDKDVMVEYKRNNRSTYVENSLEYKKKFIGELPQEPLIKIENKESSASKVDEVVVDANNSDVDNENDYDGDDNDN